jgi:ABC-2 type transport system permease protein
MGAATAMLLAVCLGGLNVARRALRRPLMPALLLLVPLAMTLVLAAGYGVGASSRIGIAGPSGSRLADAIRSGLPVGEPHLPVLGSADVAALRDEVERGPLDLGVVIPDDPEAQLAAGQAIQVTLLSPPGDSSRVLREVVRAAVREASVEATAARLAADALGVSWTEAEELVGDRVAGPGLVVELEVIGAPVFPPGVDPFGLAARGMAVLFAFLAPMLAVPLVVADRRSGVLRRPGAGWRGWLLAGEVAGLVLLAVLPSAALVVASALLLGVSWGDPLAVAALVMATALVAGGLASIPAGWVSDGGSLVFRLVVAFAAATFGGVLIPLELFEGGLRSASFVMPHAWAIEGMRRVMLDGASVAEIAVQLGVLAATGAGLLLVGVVGLGRAVSRRSASG